MPLLTIGVLGCGDEFLPVANCVIGTEDATIVSEIFRTLWSLEPEAMAKTKEYMSDMSFSMRTGYSSVHPNPDSVKMSIW